MKNLIKYLSVLCLLIFITVLPAFAKDTVCCGIDVCVGEVFSITDPEAETFVTSEGLSIVDAISEDGRRTGYDLSAKNAGSYAVFVTCPDVRYIYEISVHPYSLSKEAEELYDVLSASWDESLDPLRKQIVYTALSGLGNIPYIAGDNSHYMEDAPDGLTCSGFVAWAYYHAGIEDFGETYAVNFKERDNTDVIPYEALLPGDIGSRGTKESGHCGIYAGQIDGKDVWIHCIGGKANTADNPGTGVTVTDEWTDFTDFCSYTGFKKNVQDD